MQNKNDQSQEPSNRETTSFFKAHKKELIIGIIVVAAGALFTTLFNRVDKEINETSTPFAGVEERLDQSTGKLGEIAGSIDSLAKRLGQLPDLTQSEQNILIDLSSEVNSLINTTTTVQQEANTLTQIANAVINDANNPCMQGTVYLRENEGVSIGNERNSFGVSTIYSNSIQAGLNDTTGTLAAGRRWRVKGEGGICYVNYKGITEEGLVEVSISFEAFPKE